MSKQFPCSHQRAGINRLGSYMKPVREKSDRRDDGKSGRRVDRSNEPWRRITGIFANEHQSSKERRDGIARLMKWIEAKMKVRRVFSDALEPLNHEDLKARKFSDMETSGLEGLGADIGTHGVGNVTPHPGLTSFARPSPARREEAGATLVLHEQNTGGQATSGTQTLSFTDEWKFSAENWARTRHCGASVEEICFEVGISAARLSALTREYCGLGASQFVDGLMVRGLKPMLFEKIRAAAFVLWGAPGSFVYEKLAMFSSDNEFARNAAQAKELVAGTPSARGGEPETRLECFTADSGGDAEHAGVQAKSKVAGRGRPTQQFLRPSSASRYFRMQMRDYFEESRAEERARRLEELCEKLRARRGRTGGQATSGTFAAFRNSDCGFRIGVAAIDGECLFDADAFALHAGFASAARLKRACLNVFGKTLRRLEEILAEEVLQFYLCAEDRELREIASRENEIALVFRARELYHRSEDRPREPFLDEWSKFEELRPHWLSRMQELMRDT